MIDSKGRIFGLINIIDLVVLIALVVVCVFLFRRVVSPTMAGAANQENIQVKFFTENSPDYAVNALEKGVNMEDDTKGIPLGKVVDFKIGQGFVYTPDSNGNQVKAYVEDYASCEVTANIKAQIVDGGALLVNGNIYAVGHSITIRAGKAKLFGRVSGIEPLVEG